MLKGNRPMICFVEIIFALLLYLINTIWTFPYGEIVEKLALCLRINVTTQIVEIFHNLVILQRDILRGFTQSTNSAKANNTQVGQLIRDEEFLYTRKVLEVEDIGPFVGISQLRQNIIIAPVVRLK